MERPSNDRLLWTASDGVRCVMALYDERRYQLRILRPHGTFRAALFDDDQRALAAAAAWRNEFSGCDIANHNVSELSDGEVTRFIALHPPLAHPELTAIAEVREDS